MLRLLLLLPLRLRPLLVPLLPPLPILGILLLRPPREKCGLSPRYLLKGCVLLPSELAPPSAPQAWKRLQRCPLLLYLLPRLPFVKTYMALLLLLRCGFAITVNNG